MSDLKERILGKKNLHSYYYPCGDTSKKQIHDSDCAFCQYEEEVLEAMGEYANEMVKQAIEVKTSDSGLNIDIGPNRLIKLGNDTYINTTEIKEARRCGNYTEINVKGESLIRQIWDADRKIIDQF